MGGLSVRREGGMSRQRIVPKRQNGRGITPKNNARRFLLFLPSVHGVVIFAQQRFNQRSIVDITMHEPIAAVVSKCRQVFRVARVRQLVEIDQCLTIAVQPVDDEIGTDETRAARDQNQWIHLACKIAWATVQCAAVKTDILCGHSNVV